MENIRELPALIAGGGVFGCGLAAALPGSLLVDENNVPGSDFTLSLASGGNIRPPRHEKAQRFYQQLKDRNVFLPDGSLRSAAVAPELAAWLLEEKVSLLLDAAVESTDDPEEFRIFTVEGEQRVRTKRFIDLRGRHREKKFWHILVSPCATGEFGAFSLRRAAQPDCAILTLPLELSCSWPEARKILREVWKNRPAELKQVKIAWSAAVFDPALFDNPVQALDCGLLQEL